MNNVLLEYIRFMIESQTARVPTQLLSPDDVANDHEDDENDVKEYSSVGGIVGTLTSSNNKRKR